MIYYYKIKGLPYTPFDENFWIKEFHYLAKKGLRPTSDKDKADLFISSSTKDVRRFIIENPTRRNYLLWTNEPRNSKTASNTHFPFLIFPKVHIMNVYTENVFTSNVTYQEKRFNSTKPLTPLNGDFLLNNKKVVALMSYYNGGEGSSLFLKGINIDLIQTRSDIAKYAFKENLIDIYGTGWPKGMSIEDSRTGDWDIRKKEILKPYSINLCFENTVSPRYITEKIWDSIENYCLPIYYGGKNSTIYEIFPNGSFIDYAAFKDPADLFQYIKKMDVREYKKRMNLCIEVYNAFLDKSMEFWDQISKKRLDNILEKANLVVYGTSEIR